MNKNIMIIADEKKFSMDCYATKRNNNVVVVGASGTGKTTGIVEPNIKQAIGSYIITDPKGNLHNKYADYLKRNGYNVMTLDLADPNGDVRYNFIDYIKSEHDVIKLAHILITGAGDQPYSDQNAFFYRMGELLLASKLATLKYIESFYEDANSVKTLQHLFNGCRSYINQNCCSSDKKNDNDEKKEVADEDKDNEWYQLSEKLECMVGEMPIETGTCVLATIASVLGTLNTIGVESMMKSEKKPIDFKEMGLKKTALFVKVSDSDRSMDTLVNVFFTQAMSELCFYADTECQNNMLPVPVRFIMDDFATNCTINDFPRMISSIRSRNISAMLLIQAESQLEQRYEKEYTTVLSNCDTYVYMGGNDLQTAKRVAERADVPYKKILNMPISTCWVFRRGDEPEFCSIYREIGAIKQKPKTKRKLYA